MLCPFCDAALTCCSTSRKRIHHDFWKAGGCPLLIAIEYSRGYSDGGRLWVFDRATNIASLAHLAILSHLKANAFVIDGVPAYLKDMAESILELAEHHISCIDLRPSYRAPKLTSSFVDVIAPDYYCCKLKYKDGPFHDEPFNIRIWNAASWVLNDLYDPQLAYGGGQPHGYKEISALYLNYCVVAASYEVTFTNSNNASTGVKYVATMIRNEITPLVDSYATLNQLAGVPYAQYKELGFGESVTLKGYVNFAQFGGVKNVTVQAGYTADIDAHPAKMIILDVLRGRPGDQSEYYGISYAISLTMYCKFSGRKTLQA